MDLKSLQLYYASQLQKGLTPEQKVGWQTAQSQKVRFETLAAIGPLKGAKILDVGCGLGAYWGYLKGQETRADYTGVDLFPNVIRQAKLAYPDTRFEARNILQRPFRPGSFDYAFLSGVFNVRVRDNWKYMRSLLTAVLRQSRKGAAFNILNSESGLSEKNRFTAGPKELVVFGKSLGVSRTLLMDHYHHLDLTLFLYKK